MNRALLVIGDVRVFCGISKPTIYRLIAKGEFPPPVKVGRRSLWLADELEAWVHMLATLRGSGRD